MTNQAKKKGAIGLDHGTKRTGFATADPLRFVVAPGDTVEGGNDGALGEIERLMDERDVTHLVVGYPLNMDGTKGGRSGEVDAFIERVHDRFPALSVVRQDERLTTREAESRLAEEGFRGPARKARKDSWSAMILLEDWIREGEPEGLTAADRPAD